MSRIRSVKPEFFTSEQVVECSPTARLLFVGLWCFCDDAGIHPASPKRLKMEVFPADDISADEVLALIAELIRAGLVREYEVNGERFWIVTGWHHQKIDKPTFRHPKPSFGEESARTRREVGEASGTESKGVESSRDDGNTHTQPSLVQSESAGPVPTADARAVKPAATDEPLRALLDAWNTSTGDRLVWSAKYFQPTEAAHRLGATPELLARAAKAYTGMLGDGPRSFVKFCHEFDRWISLANSPPKPKKPDRRDDPRLGSPSPAARNVFTTPESVLAARGARDEF